jgi:hypothetical protein
MSINSTVRKAGPYTGNDLATSFTFAFKVFKASDVLVVRTTIASGLEETLTLSSDYTVTLNSDQNVSPGGAVVLPAALASTYKLTLASQVPYSQPAVFTNTGGFYPTVLNDSLDRLAIQIQQLKEASDRALGLGLSTSGSVKTTLPAPVAGSFVGWSADGLSLVNYAGVAGVPVSAFMMTVVAQATAALARDALGLSAPVFPGQATAQSFVMSQAPNAYWSYDSVSQMVIHNFDLGAYLAYSRFLDAYDFRIGGVTRLFVDQFGPGRNNDASTPNGLPRKSQVDTLVAALNSRIDTIVSTSVSVITGVISHGGTLPLPAGYTQAQCHWVVSPRDYGTGTIDIQESGAQAGFTNLCYADDTTRVVTSLFGFNTSGTGGKSCNYIVIGVK